MIGEIPENTTVVSPDNAVFNCVATARPRPAITWWRREENGSLTQIPSDSDGYSITNTNSSKERVLTSTLTIIETEPSDALIYICVAENIAGTARASAELTVHGKYSPATTYPADNRFMPLLCPISASNTASIVYVDL